MQHLFSEPLSCFRILEDTAWGTFRFAKGNTEDFHYKNLSEVKSGI